ncbi:MAG: hypothetical protein K2P19_09205, partial [Kineothrix sp.]|nr:hypothetical protein [Kineothrix sp.]
TNPHWNDETGIAVWGNVPESSISGEVGYYYRLYRQDEETPPEPGKDKWILESSMNGNGMIDEATDTCRVNMYPLHIYCHHFYDNSTKYLDKPIFDGYN